MIESAIAAHADMNTPMTMILPPSNVGVGFGQLTTIGNQETISSEPSSPEVDLHS